MSLMRLSDRRLWRRLAAGVGGDPPSRFVTSAAGLAIRPEPCVMPGSYVPREERRHRGVTIPFVVWLCVGASVFCSSSLTASELSFGAELDGNSRYVWRGLALNDGPVLQPSAWVSLAGFTVTPWANFAFREDEAPAGFNELDVTLDFSRDMSDLTVTPSFSAYLYPNQADAPPTGELALALSCAVGPVCICTDHSVDLLATPGAYFGDAGLSFESDLVPDLTVEASASAGWGSACFNEANFEVSRAALCLGEADLALTWSPGGLFYLRPHAALSVLLDRELRAAVPNPVLITGGLVVGREF